MRTPGTGAIDVRLSLAAPEKRTSPEVRDVPLADIPSKSCRQASASGRLCRSSGQDPAPLQILELGHEHFFRIHAVVESCLANLDRAQHRVEWCLVQPKRPVGVFP